jgi:alcohol dehydrogenase class IV
VCGESDRFSAPLKQKLKEEANVESVVFHCPKGEPTVQSAIDCTKLASENMCELVVAVGGGTAVDTGKCVAAMLTNGGAERDIYDFLEVVGKAMPIEKRPRPFVAIPTTAGPGAELTKNSVLEAGDRKVSMRHPLMLPDLVIVDPKLTVQMPRDVTAHTGLDALTQCIEPYVCNSPNPVTDSLSMSGIKLGAKSLRRCLEQPEDINARTDMALCAMYGGMALANAKLGAVHGFSGTLGGLLHAPHGAICAALLPHCVKMNVKLLETRVMDENPQSAKEGLRRYKEVANACLGKDDATVAELVKWIEDLVSFCGVPKLSTFGMKDEDVSESVSKSMQSSSMKGNPVALTVEELEEMLRNAM